MQKDYTALFEAIRARCQQAHWFGPDALKPGQEVLPRSDDPFVDEYAGEAIVLDDPRRAGFAFPPATEEQVRTTETCLGFTLPPLLRGLYLQVANGGFGPGTGLYGVKGGYKGAYPSYDGSLGTQRKSKTFSYTTYQQQAAQASAKGMRASMHVPRRKKLEQLVLLCDLGCCEEVGVDSQERMFLLSPTESNAFYHLEQLPWNFEEWFWRWVKGKSLLELYSPGAA